MSMTIEEIKRVLIERFSEDEEMLSSLSEKEVLRIWKAIQKREARKYKKGNNDIWEWEVPLFDIVDAKKQPSDKLIEIRGIVSKILKPYEYFGCPIHRTKLKEMNGEYYCVKCNDVVTPATLKIIKFFVDDGDDEILVSTYPLFENEIPPKEKTLSEGDYVAVRGNIVKSDRFGISFNARAFKILLKAKKIENVQEKVENENVKVKQENERTKNNDMSDDIAVMYDTLRFKMINMLKRKDLFKYSLIKFVARDHDVEKFIETFFDEVETDDGIMYRLKDEWRKKLEEEGLL